ncbi:hypothetical protein HY486_01650 [Candidatus Woesearchaeota archaeon]|nr:hypothetical protein [Candidatus Woesearchaeota archaeon]
MPDLSARISRYMQDKELFEQSEEQLFKDMERAFAAYIAELNPKLPSGHSIKEYEVMFDVDQKTPIIGLNPPEVSGGVSADDLEHLNALLKDDFERIKQECGFAVHGFAYTEYLS